jgi:hypothetical protein
MLLLCSSVRVTQAIGETGVEIWKDKMTLEAAKYTEALALMLRSRLHTVDDFCADWKSKNVYARPQCCYESCSLPLEAKLGRAHDLFNL